MFTFETTRRDFVTSRSAGADFGYRLAEHMAESSIEFLRHSVGGVTYRHYAHRDPLAFKAIMSLLQPTAFNALVHGFDGECPCCRRRFRQA